MLQYSTLRTNIFPLSKEKRAESGMFWCQRRSYPNIVTYATKINALRIMGSWKIGS